MGTKTFALQDHFCAVAVIASSLLTALAVISPPLFSDTKGAAAVLKECGYTAIDVSGYGGTACLLKPFGGASCNAFNATSPDGKKISNAVLIQSKTGGFFEKSCNAIADWPEVCKSLQVADSATAKPLHLLGAAEITIIRYP